MKHPIPTPKHLTELTAEFVGRWVPVTEALPPIRMALIVMVRGDNCPAYGWMKYAAGDRSCPYFIVPQRGALEDRGTYISLPSHAKRKTDVTHWFSATEKSLPGCPPNYTDAEWGLGDGFVRTIKFKPMLPPGFEVTEEEQLDIKASEAANGGEKF